MSKRAVFERSRREISVDVSVGVHILLLVEQSSLESQARGCTKTPIHKTRAKPQKPALLIIAIDNKVTRAEAAEASYKHAILLLIAKILTLCRRTSPSTARRRFQRLPRLECV